MRLQGLKFCYAPKDAFYRIDIGYLELIQLTNRQESFAAKAWKYSRFWVAGLLMIAAGAKIANMTEILAGNGLLAVRPVLLLVIGLESSIAVYLLIGEQAWSWLLTVILFFVFSAASAYAITTGQDCNCISQKISPRMMLPFDLTVLAIVFWVRPSVSFSWNKPLMCHVFGSVGAGVLVAGAAASFDPAEKSDPLQFLLADMMVEKRWPLDAKLHPDLAELERGKWMVVIVRRDCEHCRELLEQHFADPHAHRPNERTVTFIAGETAWRFMLDEIAVESSSGTSISWPGEEPFVASPAIFLIENGRVVSAKDGEDADAFLEELMSRTL